MRYLLGRLGLYVVIGWAAITMNFLVPRLMPGDPIQLLLVRLHGNVNPSAISALRKAFGLTNASIWSQYLDYLGHLAHFDLGRSISFFPTPVSEVLATSLPWTVALVGLSTIISFVLGTLLGVLAAWRRGSWIDSLLPATTVMQAVPYFWLALFLVLVFASGLHWFPASGAYDLDVQPGFSWEFATSALYHGVLPALTIVASSIAGWLLSMRNMMVTTLGEDYVMLAEAKGLRPRRIMLAYAARNAILPNVTGFALALGFVVSGALLTEIIFSYPGLGYTLFEAVDNEDFPLMQGIFLIISLAVLAANLVVDLFYIVLDPRTRQEV